MRTKNAMVMALAGALTLAGAVPAVAEPEPKAVYKLQKGPDGKVYRNKMTGCFSDCLKQGRNMGFSEVQVQKYCAGRPLNHNC